MQALSARLDAITPAIARSTLMLPRYLLLLRGGIEEQQLHRAATDGVALAQTLCLWIHLIQLSGDQVDSSGLRVERHRARKGFGLDLAERNESVRSLLADDRQCSLTVRAEHQFAF